MLKLVTHIHCDSQLLQATHRKLGNRLAQGKKLDSRVCYVFVSLLLIFVVLAFDACIIFSGMSPGCQSQIQEWINQGSYGHSLMNILREYSLCQKHIKDVVSV